jgi:hypothetical protein
MQTPKKIASDFVVALDKKLQEKHKTREDVTDFFVFIDPTMHKQRRWGWYAWFEINDGSQIGYSDDIIMDELKPYTEEEVMYLINMYMKDYLGIIAIEIQDRPIGARKLNDTQEKTT